MPLKVGELYEELNVKDNTGPQLQQAERSFGRMGGTVNALKSTLANIGIGALGAEITRVSTEFNAGMANVASLIPGNAKRVRELTGEVQKLRIQLGVTGQDATQGLYQTISAFGDTSDTMRIMEINAKAAKGGVASLTDAINLTSAVTKAYGDTSADAIQNTADLALLTVRLGQTTFPELAGSIGAVTPLAKALGVSQKELFAVMATGLGVTGGAAEVATQFRGILQALMAPTADMTALMKSLGYENGQAMLKQLGVVGTLQKIQQAAKDSGKPLQAYISQIEGQTLALSLAGPQAEDYRKKLEEMGKASGTTNAAFKEQADGVNWLGQKLKQAGELGKVAMEKLGFVGPLITLGATISQVVTTVNIFRMAKLASAAAITTETAALGANTEAQLANAAAQGTGAAVGRVGIGARALGAGGSLLTGIGGTVGVGGGLAGLGVAGVYAAGVVAASALAYEIYGIVKYTKQARDEQAKLNASYNDAQVGLKATQTRLAGARGEKADIEKQFGAGSFNYIQSYAREKGVKRADIVAQLNAGTLTMAEIGKPATASGVSTGSPTAGVSQALSSARAAAADTAARNSITTQQYIASLGRGPVRGTLAGAGAGAPVQVMVGIDPRNGNVTGYVDNRVAVNLDRQAMNDRAGM